MDFRVVFLAKVISAQTFEKKNLVEFGMKVISEATSLMGESPVIGIAIRRFLLCGQIIDLALLLLAMNTLVTWNCFYDVCLFTCI